VAALAQQGGISQQSLEEVEVAVKGAKVGLDAARNSENVYAPFAGVVLETMVPLNSKVGPGQALIKLAALEQVRIPISVNESLIDVFAKGQRAFVVIGGDTIYGTVDKVALGAQEAGHMFPVDVVFSNKSGRFRAGMFLTVNVITAEMPQALSIPVEIVLYDEQGPYVFTVSGDKAVKTRIEPGIRGGERLSANAGLKEGDLVVATGASKLSDGVKVKVVN
jgi:RND family efflux transporter MFP subunit